MGGCLNILHDLIMAKDSMFSVLLKVSVLMNLRSNFSAFVGSVFLTTLVRKNSVFWDIIPCNPLKMAFATGFHTGFLIGLFFNPEDGGDIFL
jgi:hypothetical protein